MLKQPKNYDQIEKKEIAPHDKLERLLVELWQEVLGRKVGIDDNFFELGGNSIKAVMVMNRLQEKINSIFHPVSIFDAPTISKLAEYCQKNYPTLFKEYVDQVDLETISSSDKLTGDQIDNTTEHLRHRISGKSVKPDMRGRKNKPAIFIFSPPRSGSTLLRVILGGHPRLFSPPELYLLSFNTLKERKNALSGRMSFLQEGLIRTMMEMKSCQKEEAERLLKALEEQDISTKEFFRLMQTWLGDRIIVDKTPPYAFNPEVLKRTDAEFEEAIYIHLVRHPAGTVCSFEKSRVDLAIGISNELSLSPRQKGESWWLISHQNILAFLENIPTNSQYLVKFEDLVKEPEPTVKGLCQFLDIDFYPDMLNPYKEKRHRMTDGVQNLSKIMGDPKFHTHQGITASIADQWKQEYPEDFLCKESWNIAESLGYTRHDFTDDDREVWEI